MKKIFLLFMLISTLYAAGAKSTEVDAGAKAFLNHWSDEEHIIVIYQSKEDYHVSIESYSDGYESIKWSYTCSYDETKIALIATDNGVKTVYIYDDELDCEYTNTAYSDGTASFIIQNGCLIWKDEVEDAGSGLQFRNMGNFEGHWESDDLLIDLYIIDDSYRCFITRTEKEDTATKWQYCCNYIAENNELLSDHHGLKEIYYTVTDDEDEEIGIEEYHDGYAVFSINSDGYLLWNDMKEHEGDGYLFKLTQEQD